LVFGGTFDPPHLAHAVLPSKAAAQLGCAQILYVPASINPLKADSPPTSNEHRLAMLLLAIADVPDAKISTIEFDREGPSFTIDTLRALQAIHPDTRLFLLMGADQSLDFHRWKQWQQILELAQPAVMLRPPWNETSFVQALRKKYAEAEAEQWHKRMLHLPMLDINATEIRRRLAAGESVQGMLHRSVHEYIQANHLYQPARAAALHE
jgi:nicotinate-nucleotide adenylyltransferase